MEQIEKDKLIEDLKLNIEIIKKEINLQEKQLLELLKNLDKLDNFNYEVEL